MNPVKLVIIHTFCIILTILIVVYSQFAPERRETIFPRQENPNALYSDEMWGGKTSADWIDQTNNHWQCHIVKSELTPVCGLSMNLSSSNKTMDFSRYHALSIKLKYTGKNTKLRIYLRNHNPAYSSLEDTDSLKFNSISLPPKEFTSDETIIKLSEFSVDDWWIKERNISRELAHPELTNIFAMGMDIPYPQALGYHDIQIEKIELIGPKFIKERLFLMLIAAWMIGLAAESIVLLALFKKRKSLNKQAIAQITAKITRTQSTNNTTPPNSLSPKINAIFNNGKAPQNVSLVLFKIDHFKRIKKRRGAAAAQRILTALQPIVISTLQSNDTLAHWGEEEYLILSTDTDQNSAVQLTERVRLCVANHTFEEEEPMQASVSIGGTFVVDSDDFGTAFMRAEQALYRASNDGQNSIHWL